MSLRRFLLVLPLLLAAGCGDDDSPTAPGTQSGNAVPTDRGSPTGTPVSGTVGAAGGTLATADGRFTLLVPPGALSSDTGITIQPITNTAWGGVGDGYRLSPDGLTFALPVGLEFALTAEDLDGSAPVFADVALQDAQGYWYILKDRTYDAATSTLTVSTPHFSDYSLIEGVQIRPGRATVPTGGHVGLTIKYCGVETYTGPDADLVALVATCSDDLAPLGTFTNWSVNAVPGGTASYGTVTPGAADHVATYAAPAVEPQPNPVAVSVLATYLNRSELLVSNITVKDEEWVGTSTVDYEVFLMTTTVTWRLVGTDGTRKSFIPVGSVVVSPLEECITFEPGSGPIADQDGVLVVDYATDPPTFEGVGETSWNGQICSTCPEGCYPFLIGGAWFYASGSVSADSTTISGTASIGGAVNNFMFTRQL
jgi:hypothetical protein